MTSIISTPDFPFSGHYYPEILEDLIQYLRVNLPELTDEDETEPFIQLTRAFALVGHLNNVLLDLVAKEGYLPTAQLRASVGRLLALIDYRLAQASPASADLACKLSGPLSGTIEVMAEASQVTTKATSITPAIEYENLAAKSCSRTDQLYRVFSYDASTSTYTDHTTASNTPTVQWTPGWAGGAAAGDMIYFSHLNVHWNILTLKTDVAGSGITGTWEYYDGNLSLSAPDSVTNLGSTLKIVVDALLGTTDRSGAIVRVTSNITGAHEDIVSEWDGSNNYIETSGFLGQATPSTTVSDYSIGVSWREPVALTDGTSDFTVTGEQDVEYTYPQDLTHNWRSVEVNSISAMWLRYRIISVSTPSTPTFDTATIENGDLYTIVSITQGTSREDNPLGSSTGLADQSFTLANYPVIDDETLKCYVTEASIETEWVRVTNFLSSLPTDKHFKVEFGDEGGATIVFGDGNTGKIPAAGVDNIRATYRTLEEEDGNVGANEIDQNQSGSSYIASVWNPRPAIGYQVREGGTTESLNRAKDAGPASIRTGLTAASIQEVETLTVNYQDATGARPFARALAVEEAYGPKTIGVIVVGAGGQAATTDQLEALELYFNGDPESREYGILVANHRIVAENFTPETIDVTATIYGGNQTSVETILTGLLSPVAEDEDGNYIWEFGSEVPVSRIIAEIFESSPRPRKVVLTVPASDVNLGPRELPVVGTLSITVVA